MESIVFKIATVGALGIGAQWLAWRFNLPSVVLLAVAGLLAGPATGILSPAADFGDLFRPLVGVAVAIILFEGGLTLNFAEIRHTPRAVRRMITIGAPLGWVLGALAAHYVAGLSWATAIVFGAILVVTGPTVILPLLRNARLLPRVGAVLRWEGIINDPIGALMAVLAFEVLAASAQGEAFGTLALKLVTGIIGAVAIGLALGELLVLLFRRGLVPEFLKAPMTFAAVLVGYEAANLLLAEAGLLAVTAMGILIGNSRLASLDELRRFKEYMTVLLVSGVFILLIAAMNVDTLALLDWRAVAFVLVTIFVVRPLVVMTATLGTELGFKERAFVAWIAPRGVVAVAVSGLFGAALVEIGHADGERMVALAFVIVMVTIIAHGFSLGWLARRLGLVSAENPGVLIVGAAPWTTDLAAKLAELNVPVMIADSSWNRLSRARMAGIPVFRGDILSEAAEHTVDFNRFAYLFAATDDPAYNALVASNFGPEIGREHVVSLASGSGGPDSVQLPPALTCATTFGGLGFWEIVNRSRSGWTFQAPKLTDALGQSDILAGKPEFVPILVLSASGAVTFFAANAEPKGRAGDTLLGFAPATPAAAEKKRTQGPKAAAPPAAETEAQDRGLAQ